MKIKRFSHNNIQEGLNQKTDQAIDFTESLSTQLLDNKYLGKTRGVKRWGRFVNSLAKIGRKKRNELDN